MDRKLLPELSAPATPPSPLPPSYKEQVDYGWWRKGVVVVVVGFGHTNPLW